MLLKIYSNFLCGILDFVFTSGNVQRLNQYFTGGNGMDNVGATEPSRAEIESVRF